MFKKELSTDEQINKLSCMYELVTCLFFCAETGHDHEDHFRLVLPPGCTYRALQVGHVHAFSTRIQQSFKRQSR